MAGLKDFIPCSDDLNIGGADDVVYFMPACEFTGSPKSKDKLSTPVTTAGASVEVGEAYPTVTTAGKGYWRKLLCVPGTVEIETNDEGEAGTLAAVNTLKGKVRGFSSAAKEFMELLGSNSGIVFLVSDKSDSLLHEVGTPTAPAVKKTVKGGLMSKSRGFDFEMEAKGRAPRTVDPVAFPLDFVPNT